MSPWPTIALVLALVLLVLTYSSGYNQGRVDAERSVICEPPPAKKDAR